MCDERDREENPTCEDTVSVDERNKPGRRDEELEKLEPGVRLDRYVTLERIGVGGFGQVYSAYDPYLDRKIALKLLKKSSRSSDSRAAVIRERMLAEAQAMAQLSHPNIVSVFDVGTHEDQVFMAMEFIDGISLTKWLSAKKRHWREKREVLLQAGRGLAAAHKAGIIHRDFKPDNVVVGHRGEVKVMDFGIAAASEKSSNTPHNAEEVLKKLMDSDSLEFMGLGTGWRQSDAQQDCLTGTPAYMSPEHFTGERINEQSDQFSFCVSLFEAMYAGRPFVGRNLREIRRAIAHGAIASVPKDRTIPSWMRKVILKGLATDPSGRFPAMDDLIDALDVDPGKRRRRIQTAIGVLGLMMATALGVRYWLGQAERKCERAGDRMEEIWNAGRKAEVQAAFARSGVAYAGPTFERIAGMLDEYTAAWREQRIDACAATNVRGEQSARMLDKRMLCLDRRMNELGALLTVFKDKADAKIVENAVEAVSSLGDLSACANKEILGSAVALPSSEETRHKVNQLTEQLNHGTSLLKTGHSKEGLELVQRLLNEAHTVDYKPLQGELLHTLGSLQIAEGQYAEAEETFRLALITASEAKDDRTVLKIRMAEMFNDGYHLAKGELSDKLYTNALSELRRSGYNRLDHATIVGHLGKILFVKGKYAESREYLEQCLAIRKEVQGEEHLSVGETLNNLAVISYLLGDLQTALKHIGQSIRIKEKTLGKAHPDVGLSYNNQGIHLMHLGRWKESQRDLTTSLTIRENALGKNHPLVAETLTNLALLASERGSYGHAESVVQRARSIFEQAFGHDHPRVGYIIHVQGAVAMQQGRLEQATTLLEKARDIRERTLGKEHSFYAETLMALGQVLIEKGKAANAKKVLDEALLLQRKSQGDKGLFFTKYLRALGELYMKQGASDEAMQQFKNALAEIDKQLGSSHPSAAFVRSSMGKCQLRERRFDEASRYLKSALRSMEELGIDSGKLGEVRFALAKATWELGDRVEAVRLAEDASRELAQADWSLGKDRQRQVNRWLRNHRV